MVKFGCSRTFCTVLHFVEFMAKKLFHVPAKLHYKQEKSLTSAAPKFNFDRYVCMAAKCYSPI